MPILTRFERTRLIGARALQISMGAPALVKEGAGTPLETAKKELEDNVLPLTVIRHFPNGEEKRVELN